MSDNSKTSYAEVLKNNFTSETKQSNWEKVTHFPKKKIYKFNEQQYRYNTGKVRKYGRCNYLNNIYTLSFSKLELNTIFTILFNNNLKKLRKKFKYATIYDKEGKNIQINKNIRKSKKLIFREGQPKYNEFNNWFLPIIKNKLLNYECNDKSKIDDVKLLKHFDVLKYPKYGYFKPHRDDTETKEMQKVKKKGYHIYTLIVCLSDNKNLPEDSGATCVWTNFNNVSIFIGGGRTYERHLFATGTKLGYGIVFPSDLLHSGNLCLGETYKLNINIAIKYNYVNHMISIDYKYFYLDHNCTNCLLHNKYGLYRINEMRKKLFYAKNLPNILNTFSDGIIINITEFLGNFRQCHCIRKKESINNLKYGMCKQKNACRCGCKTCGGEYNHNYCDCQKCEYEREQEELWESRHDKYCNGHDY
jgi:hypothetical protein